MKGRHRELIAIAVGGAVVAAAGAALGNVWAPLLAATLSSAPLNWLDYAGVALWLIGFVF